MCPDNGFTEIPEIKADPTGAKALLGYVKELTQTSALSEGIMIPCVVIS